MEPFGDHLRTDEDIALVAGKGIDDVLVGGFVTGRIQIHAQHAGFGEEGLYLIFDTLGTETDHLVFASAFRADGRHGCAVAAVMAAQFVLALVVGHRHVALDTTGRFAARHTLYLRSIAASVLEEDDLFMILQDLTDTVHERVGEMTVHLLARILALEVDKVNIRQLGTSEPLGQRNQSIHPFECQKVRFHRGCSRT